MRKITLTLTDSKIKTKLSTVLEVDRVNLEAFKGRDLVSETYSKLNEEMDSMLKLKK